MGKRKGQSTLEYILILAAIIVAIAVLGKGLIRVGTENVMRDANGVLNQASDKLSKDMGLTAQGNTSFTTPTKPTTPAAPTGTTGGATTGTGTGGPS